jgi:hypothetical protein
MRISSTASPKLFGQLPHVGFGEVDDRICLAGRAGQRGHPHGEVVAPACPLFDQAQVTQHGHVAVYRWDRDVQALGQVTGGGTGLLLGESEEHLECPAGAAVARTRRPARSDGVHALLGRLTVDHDTFAVGSCPACRPSGTDRWSTPLPLSLAGWSSPQALERTNTNDDADGT